MKHLLSVVVLVAVFASLAFGGQRLAGKNHAMRSDNDASFSQRNAAPSAVQGLKKPSALTWVIVDSANNAFGGAGWNINPLAYDPSSNALTIIHRGRTGYGSSGQLWYDLSTDGGATWARVPGGLNAGVAGNNSRYPSGSISNGTHSSDLANVSFVYSNPELTGGVFGAVRYGNDIQIGTGAVTSIEEEPPPTFSSQTWNWSSKNSSDVYWVAGHDFGYMSFHTTDYVTVDTVTPAAWYESNFQHDASGHTLTGAAGSYDYINGAESQGVEYLGMMAIFNGDTLAVADTNFQYNYNLGYSKSTDKGATWSQWVRPQVGPSKNWNGLPGFGPTWYIAAGYGASARPNAHMLVDANGKVHFLTVVVDTATSVYAVAEFFEGSSGWESKIVKSGLNTHTIQDYYNPADPYSAGEADLNQDAWDLSVSQDSTGNIIAIAWLDAATSSVTDTLPDIWGTSRNLGGDWGTPVNVTQSAGAELIMHTAPLLKTESTPNTYTIYFSRQWEHGLNPLAFPPSNSGPNDFLVSSFSFVQTPTAVTEKPPVVRSYALDQNYPNPFNPKTTIKYTVAKSVNVSLKVYNVLGQEVATLVNEVKNPGTYSVDFGSGKFASGVYFYALKAGSFNEVKKMVLMK